MVPIAFTPLVYSIVAALGAAAWGGIKALAKEKTENSGSLLRATKGSRVEPICLIDNDLVTWDKLVPLLHTSTNIFASIYLQALALSDTTVAGTKVLQRLDGLNPNRESTSAIEFLGNAVKKSGDRFSMEGFKDLGVGGAVAQFVPNSTGSFDEALPSPEDFMSMESQGSAAKFSEDKPKSSAPSAQAMDFLKDAPDLSVGKLLEVSLREQGELFKIPVMVRLATTLVPNVQLVEALKSRFESRATALERAAGVRSGRLHWINDILLAKDVRRKRFNELAYDETGLHAKLNPDSWKNAKATVTTGQMSVARASNIMVMSSETIRKTEINLGGSFEKLAFRTRLFESTGMMLLISVDRDADMVTYYYDGIEGSNTVTGSSLKNQSAKNGPDIESVMKAMLSGSGRF